MTIDIRALFTFDTADTLLNRGLDIAQAIGLPVTSWRAGDPTRSLYKYLSEVLGTFGAANAELVKAGFRSSAKGPWLDLHAEDIYGVTRVQATNSTPKVTLHNAGGGFFPEDPGDLTLKSSITGATFHNTSSGVLSAGATVEFDLVCDVAGSAGTVAIDDIDELVTTRLGVVVVSSTAAIGLDEQDDASLNQDCADTRGALSPNGPADAYEFVARQKSLTGVDGITRSKSTNDSATGQVTVYICGPDGTASSPQIAAVQIAVERFANPLCITPTVVGATPVSVDVTATISGDNIPADFVAELTLALELYFATLAIANEDGATVFRSPIIARFHNTLDLTSVSLSAPASDTPYTAGQVPILGTVSITEV